MTEIVRIARGGLVVFLLLAAGNFAFPSALAQWRIERYKESLIAKFFAEPSVEIPLTASGAAADYAVGDPSAPVTIVEFSDFECPMCRELASAMNDILEEYKDKIYFVQRSFPIDRSCNSLILFNGHTHACHAAMFARCAGEQGKFREASRYLFTLPALDDERVPAARVRAEIDRGVEALKLDRAAMEQCLAADRQRRKIEQDILAAETLGLRGTPTLWINGKKLEGPSEELLRLILARLLAKP